VIEEGVQAMSVALLTILEVKVGLGGGEELAALRPNLPAGGE
jgi:hypothetical protein